MIGSRSLRLSLIASTCGAVVLALANTPAYGVAGDDDSFDPSVSATGRYVAFASDADNLSAQDNNDVQNIFVRDLSTGAITLVSRGTGRRGPQANGDSGIPSISASGRYVAFSSRARNLSRADRNNISNVYVRDLRTGRTTLVSRKSAADGRAGANGNSFSASISANGRYVAFRSSANNLSRVDRNSVNSVFVRDLRTKRTILVSRQSAAAGGAGADGSAMAPSISANGRYVAFASPARNLTPEGNAQPGPLRFTSNVFVRDLRTKRTILVSRQSAADGGAGADGASLAPSISDNGRRVVYESDADNLSNEDDDTARNIFVRDLRTRRTILVSRQSVAVAGAAADGASFNPSLSGDGRHVAFESVADNLSPDTNIGAGSRADLFNAVATNIYVRNLSAGTTALASRQSAADGGAGADDLSRFPSISSDGRIVAFESFAGNLSANTRAARNVFARDLARDVTELVS